MTPKSKDSLEDKCRKWAERIDGVFFIKISVENTIVAHQLFMCANMKK